MSSKVELLITLVNKGEESQQENALNIYNELMEDPVSFYFQLEEILRSNKNSLVKYQACNFMEIILRTKIDQFSQEQLDHLRQGIPDLCEKLENDDFKHFTIIPMRLLKGCDQEWRDFYAKTTGKSYSLELAIQMHDHLDKDVMQQPIVNDTKFAFSYKDQLCNSPNKIAPIVFCKLIGLYASLYPDRAEDIVDHLPKILEMAKNSRQYDYYLFNIFWNQLGIIFSEIAAQIPIFYDFANVAFEYSSDESLNLYYRLVPLFMFGKTVRDISMILVLKSRTV
ncbi:hypothetical protein TVAG_001460 [Trichomonas vaginalis G3]|uniref:Uncharacterized protein n=1 Tax=Trichomonas vaginalis (strain ATCC PRA-98 / G3) TaxID=412133 RepID=A2FLH9_TRIV3|nr:hypothetical protein TVAGG3_0616560 [Trichomonas vaginalis G3]EAX94229.1 hypothetical protein TVAG_001460 [Trichomonas vaginalis G3]KAI5503588.1 hypothetical protein TVAGG3_0616560 [Trichomonas vaginalis G3]|eukprot:XP_001307159.1 hypothetical protein [Trichomonas vaginalis G3]